MPSIADVYAEVSPTLTPEGQRRFERALGRMDGAKAGVSIGQSIGGGMRVGLSKTVPGIAKGLVAGFAALKGLQVFGSFVQDARESARISRITANAIRATGGAAKISAGQVGDLATAISNKTGVDDEAIQSGANLLLTFKKVRNEVGQGNRVFDRATQAATDLAAAGFGDLNGASKQLGKALNDPLKGISALAKAGVTFTKQQKDQIKTLVESGRTLEAQKVILGEVEAQVGGAAAAAADPLARLKVIAGNLAEEVGGFLLPTVDKFADLVADKVIPGAKDLAGAFRDGFTGDTSAGGFLGFVATAGEKAGGLVTFVRTTVIPGVKGLFDLFARGDFTGDLRRAFGWSEDAPVVDALFRIREKAVELLGYVKSTLVPGMVTAFGSLKTKIEQALPDVDLSALAETFTAQAKSWGGALIAGVRGGLETGDWSALGQTIGKGLVAAFGAGVNIASDLAKKIGELFKKVDWVGLGIQIGKVAIPLVAGLALGLLNVDFFALIKGIASHWQEALLAVVAIFLTPAKFIGPIAKLLGRIPLAGKLLEWGLLAFKGLADKLGAAALRALGFVGEAMLAGFRQVFPKVGAGLAEALKLLPLRIGVLGLELQAKAVAALRGFRDALVRGFREAITATAAQAAELLRPFATAGSWLLRAGGELVGGLYRGITGRISGAVQAVGGVRAALVQRAADAKSWLTQAGGQVIQGLFQGGLNALAGAGEWIRRVGSTIIGGVKGFFGIKSPSTVFAAIGLDLIRGLAQGLVNNIGAVLQPALTALGQAFRTAFNALPGFAKTAIREVVAAFLGMVQTVLDGAAAAFGWVPKLGDKLKTAAADFRTFRDRVNDALGGVKSRTVTVSARVAASTQIGAGVDRRTAISDSIGRAAGGRVFGRGTETSDSIRARLSNNEHVLTAKEVRGFGGHGAVEQMRAAARTGALGYAAGGRVGFQVAPRLEGMAKFEAAITAFNTRVDGMARKLAAAQAGPTSAGLNGALAFARSQAGRPYVWGSAGPGGYDCSGFMAALTNVARGRNPYSRLGSTATFPWAGFRPGVGAFTIGSTPNAGGGIGHMAGTLNGVNVESRGGQGVVIGGSARGARNPLFSERAYLAGFANGGRVLPGDPPFDVLARNGRAFRPGLLKALAGQARTMDTGGEIRPGWNPPIYNGTGRAEPVTTARSMDQVVAELQALRGAVALLARQPVVVQLDSRPVARAVRDQDTRNYSGW